MFDRDEDGLLNEEELTRATETLLTIKIENSDDDTAEVKGDSAEGERGEQISKVWFL